MKPFLRLLLPVLVLALAACQGPGANGPDTDDKGPDDDPQPLAGVITGTLTDSAGDALAGAKVTLGYAGVTVAALEPASAQSYATNEHGQFAFDVGEAGEYTLAWMDDKVGALRRVSVNRDADGNLTSDPITMQAAELGEVAGRVATRGTEPWAFLLGTSFLARTNVDGTFLISRVPAGNYLLAPGLLGVRGKAIEVTVEPGATTTVSELLEFGPVITSVNPDGFQNADDFVSGNPGDALFSIRGSGFGNSMGVSQLRYGSLPVNGYVTSWSDEEIVMRMFFSNLYAGAMHDDLRFTISTISGEARSERLGVVNGAVHSGTCNDEWDPENTWVRAEVYSFGLPVGGAPVEFAVQNGVARSAPRAPAGTIFQTDENGCVNVVVEPEPAGTPVMVVNASYEGIELRGTAPIAEIELQLDSPVYYHDHTDDSVTVTGQLVDRRNGAAITGNGFAAGVDFDYSTETYRHETPITLDADGRFSLSVPVDLMTSNQVQLFVLYSGVSIAYAWFEFEPAYSITATGTPSDPARTVEIEPGAHVNFLMNVDETTAASGQALYIQLNNSLPLYVDWQGDHYYSDNPSMFEANSISGYSTSGLSTMGINDLTECRGSCVILDSQAGTAYITVENWNYESVSLELYAYTDVFQDLGEPTNDSRDGAILIDISNYEESGALETVNDVDYFLVGGPEGSWVTIEFLSPNFPAAMWVETASGEHKDGPFYNGDAVTVVGGDYLRIEATGPYAAPSAESEYNLWSIW